MYDDFIFNKRLGDVYDCEGYTTAEVLSYFYEKINDFIERFNELEGTTQERLDYLLGEGLSIEIANKINELYENGTLAQIINNNLFGELNEHLKEGFYYAKDKEELTTLMTMVNNNKRIVIRLPQSIEIDLSNFEFTRENITIENGFIIGTPVINNANDLSLINFKNVVFKDGIIIKRGRGINFENCGFLETNKAINICPPNAPDYNLFHTISMVNVNHCNFKNVNYALYVYKNNNNVSFISNDFVFSNSIINRQLITGIYADEIDGIVINNNVFFTSTGSTTKEYNIFIENGDWINIDSNQLFESGFESIYLKDFRHANITANNIAWNGVRKPCSAIRLESTDTTSDKYFAGIVSGNNISKTTKHGIDIIKCRGCSVIGNTIEVNDTNKNPYIGSEDLSTFDHYGIYLDFISEEMVFNHSGNNMLNGKAITNHKFISNLKNEVQIYTDKEGNSVIDGIYNTVILNGATTTITNITSPTNENLINGKKITLIAKNNGYTIESNNRLFLQGRQNLKLRGGDVLEFIYVSNVWYLINYTKSFNEFYQKTLTANSNEIDLLNGENFVSCECSSVKTFSKINGGFNGQRVVFLAKNGYTSLAEGGNIKLKTSETVNIPNGKIITLYFYNNVWYEESRNF